MAEAIIGGLLRFSFVQKENIIVADINEERLSYLSKEFEVFTTSDLQDAVNHGKVLLFAVKPQNFSEIFKTLDFSLPKLFISIAAGIKLSSLQGHLKEKEVVRVMPNNPALVNKGISAISYNNVTTDSIKFVSEMFKTVGEVVEVDDSLMDAVTGLSGSGPAFVYLFVEELIEGGVTAGLSREIASKLAIQTLIGAGETLKRSGKTPDKLREMVTSPGGTTKAGLDLLAKMGFNESVQQAVLSAAKRSSDLSSEFFV